MKAIIVKYHPWTNTKAAYLRATDGYNSITISIDEDLTSDENYRKAAEILCEKIGWTDINLIQGSLKNEEVFVMVPKEKWLPKPTEPGNWWCRRLGDTRTVMIEVAIKDQAVDGYEWQKIKSPDA